jgi:hypothetical protein
MSSLADIPVEQRIVIVRGFLDVFRAAYQYTGGDLELALIIAAIRLGILEQKPMDISAISVITGIPRSTVQRKIKNRRVPEALETLQQGRRVLPIIAAVSSGWTHLAHDLTRVFLRVGKQLGLK